MTLWDLFAGNFTWFQLARELWPTIVASASAFFAGYWTGRVAEQRLWMKEPDDAE